MARVRRVHRMMVGDVAPHQQAEEREFYPELDRMLGSPRRHGHNEPPPTPRSLIR